MKITTKQFQLLTDINLVWDFMVETYDWKNDCGRAAPFFEYAITSSWMDTSYSFLDRLWFDGDKVVAFVYYENPVTDIYFNVRKGYEFLADELVDYAISNMPHFGGEQQFVLFDGQQFLKDAAAKRGFKQVYEWDELVFDLKKRGYGIYLLSNASVMQKEYWPNVECSAAFDGVVVSAFEHVMKPEEKFYRILLDRYGLRAEECVFIDDATSNAEGAFFSGLQAIVFHGDVEELRAKLRELDVAI